ncbi:MAG TPA: Ig-like domain-containing protein, partial [Planctomycetota bacterium]|nr:Ig-like domain-containing protein [Planctomycetota bacterium]
LRAGCAGAVLLLAGCAGSEVQPPVDQAPGQVFTANQKPGKSGLTDGALYLVEPHSNGSAGNLVLASAVWGRLVDLYDEQWIDTNANGVKEPTVDFIQARLIYPDFVVGEDVRDEPGKWLLEVDTATGDTRLLILRENTTNPQDEFDQLVQESTGGLAPVLPKGAALSELPPFSFVARNACLVLVFNDLLKESSIVLNETIRVAVGDPPTTPFEARVVADTNFGGISASDGKFHTNRVLVDFTVSESEQATLQQPIGLNGIGLPPATVTTKPSVAVRIPTVTAPGAGIFTLLTNLAGKPLSTTGNGPVETASPGKPIVRALRAGKATDENNGFLLDLEAPRLIGTQLVEITRADLLSQAEKTYSIDFTFDSAACAIDPVAGLDGLLLAGGLTFSVVNSGFQAAGDVQNLKVKLDQSIEPPPGSVFEGPAQFVMPWRTALEALGAEFPACFLRFTPTPFSVPAAGVSASATVSLSFSEPMDPQSVRPFDSFFVTRSDDVPQLTAFQIVVGQVVSTEDQRRFTFEPTLPLKNTAQTDTYFVNLISDDDGGVTDLAGNALEAAPTQFEFVLTETEPAQATNGWVLRFNRPYEVEPPQADPEAEVKQQIRGQYLLELEAGRIKPRPVDRFPLICDRSQAIPGAMQVVPLGVQTPLSQYGSKLHHMWRYPDVGLSVSRTDDAFYNLDIEGLALSPLGGQVVAASYPEFEMRMTHSNRLPDEFINPVSNLPDYPGSGWFDNATFLENALPDPKNPFAVVHPRVEGFDLDSSDVFLSVSSTPMVQFPWNQAVDDPAQAVTWIWRDTAVQGRGGKTAQGTGLANAGGSAGAPGGIPFLYEVTALGLAIGPGSVYGLANQVGMQVGVPSIGLPILMEHRCYPSQALSLNNFDVSIAVTSSPKPFFRAFSTGGINQSGSPVIKDPDLQVSPTGGFNGVPPPPGPPIGAPTPGQDPTVYMGQLDVVIKTSRVYTIPIGAGAMNFPVADPNYIAAVLEPNQQEQPAGTSIVLAFRGHDAALTAPQQTKVFDARELEVYGDADTGDPTLPDAATEPWVTWTQPTWQDSLDALDGFRYLQSRITFVNNIATGLSPTLTSFGVAFRENLN